MKPLSRILCIENSTFRLRSCVQRNKVIARGISLREDCRLLLCKGCFPSLFLPSSSSFVFESPLHIDPSQFRDGSLFYTSNSFEEKRKACIFQRLVSTDESTMVIVRSYFRGYLPGQQPILSTFASRNGQLRRSSPVEIEFSAEWLLPRSLFNKFPCEKSLSNDYPAVYLRNI